MFNPEIKVANIILSAKYGYRFLPVQKFHKTENERKAIKRMKKYVHNIGPLNSSRIVRLHSIDQSKLNTYEDKK